MPKTQSYASSIPEQYADGRAFRAYKLPEGSYVSEHDSMLHVPVQAMPEIMQPIREALKDHELGGFLADQLCEQLETYELAKFLVGRRS